MTSPTSIATYLRRLLPATLLAAAATLARSAVEIPLSRALLPSVGYRRI